MLLDIQLKPKSLNSSKSDGSIEVILAKVLEVRRINRTDATNGSSLCYKIKDDCAFTGGVTSGRCSAAQPIEAAAEEDDVARE